MKWQWEHDELREQWTLGAEERALLANKSGATRLGFALLLKFFHHAGSFPQHKDEIPGAVVSYVATQVGVAPEQFADYDWAGRSIAYHRAQIRQFFGFREATVQDGQDLLDWLCAALLPHDQESEHLRAAAYQRCRTLRNVMPVPRDGSPIGAGRVKKAT